jgi:hypothetical protein
VAAESAEPERESGPRGKEHIECELNLLTREGERMPNVLDAEPLRVFARRAGQKINHESVRARFEKLVFEQLLADARNFRPATEAEIAAGPAWAQCIAARGEAVSVFKLCRSASACLHQFARWLAASCELAQVSAEKHRHDAHIIVGARAIVAKFGRTNFSVAVTKSRLYCHALKTLPCEEDYARACEERVVAATGQRTWHRITSVAELRRLGRSFRNCLARAPHDSSYATGLRLGLSQFWVLRESDGKTLMAAMASAPLAVKFIDVRGPCNAPVRRSNPDLRRLAAAIGMRPDDPPPPPPGAGAARRPPPCRCINCRPRDAPLPQHAAAL